MDGEITEKYLWLNKTTLLATYDQNDNFKQRFEYGLSHTPVKFTQNSTTYYIASDHLGSPRTITDESGNVIKAIDYDSFGNVISDSNESFEIPFGFAGGLKDSDTRLLRFGYRDYDPSIGRWTARDPIGFAGGDTNLYGYVASDPVNFVDPSGLKPPTNIPPGADVNQNAQDASSMNPVDFYNAVKNNGNWDYKQQGGQYEAFGNYNFGYTGRAVGFPSSILLRGAGWAQGRAGTNDPSWGNWWGDKPYGDDPVDQYWIEEGIKDHDKKYCP